MRDSPATNAASMMRAIVCYEYGSPETVLKLAEVERPAMSHHAALVRVHASSANLDDLQYVRGEIFVRPGAFRKPRYKILGSDIAGTVEAIGKNVTQVRPGDEVMADLTSYGFGGFAEYVAVPARALSPKPRGLSFEEAACVPTAGVRALQGVMSNGAVRPGQAILINGAGGGLGTFAIQIAKSFGAVVTGVDSTAKLDLMRSVGADRVLDYTQGHYSDCGERFELILDVAAYGSPADLRPILQSQRVLSPEGRYIMYIAGGGLFDRFFTTLLQTWMKLRGSRRMSVHRGTPNRREDVARLTELIESGAVRPVLDKRYRLSQVAEALRYVEQGKAKGKVVITIDGGDT
jgi:NADPH:quinone reductase-like Zn-dependent oxidoreductase